MKLNPSPWYIVPVELDPLSLAPRLPLRSPVLRPLSFFAHSSHLKQKPHACTHLHSWVSFCFKSTVLFWSLFVVVLLLLSLRLFAGPFSRHRTSLCQTSETSCDRRGGGSQSGGPPAHRPFPRGRLRPAPALYVSL